MKQTVQFKTRKGTLTFIDIPFHTTDYDTKLGDALGYSLDYGDTYSYIGIPEHSKDDKYVIVGSLQYIHEYKAMQIMDECKNGHNEIGYGYYGTDGIVDDNINCAFVTAVKSLKSLTENYLRIYTEKPMLKPDKLDHKYIGFDGQFNQAIFESELEVYEKYIRGCGNWLVLFTPKVD